MIKTEKIKLKPTIGVITHFKSEDYSVPIMLAELIDNSISSWEKSHNINLSTFIDESISFEDQSNKINEDFNCKNFKITINFISDINDKSLITDSEIIIQDNATGMSYEEIKVAASFYSTENKGVGDLNQHGIGMKSCIGWFGKDGFIYSKTKNKPNITSSLEFVTSDKNVGEEFSPVANEWENDNIDKIFESIFFKKEDIFLSNESGTSIIIKNINDQESKLNYLSNADKISALMVFLGWKYKYYIKGGLELTIVNRVYENKKINASKTKTYKVLDFEIKPWKYSKFKGNISDQYIKKNKKDFDENALDTTIKEAFNNFENDIQIIMDKSYDSKDEFQIGKFEKETFDKEWTCARFDLCKAILEDKPLIFTRKIEIGNSKYDFKYGVISSDSPKYNIDSFDGNCPDYYNKKYGYEVLQGVSTYHHSRGIDIGPFLKQDFWKKKQPETISFAPDRTKINGISTPIRLFAEIHLNNFSTEINKTVLLWNDLKDDFISYLKRIWEITFKEVLSKMIKVEDICKNDVESKKINPSSLIKMNDAITQKMQIGKEETIVEHDNLNGINTWKYTSFYKDKTYIFSLSEERNSKNKPFICKLMNEDDESIKYHISYDFFHPIWSPINTKDSKAPSHESRIVAHPIIVALALAQWIINDKQNNAGFFNNRKNNRKDIDLFDIIDEIVQDWKDCKINEQ